MKKASPMVEVLFVVPARGISQSNLERIKQECEQHEDIIVFLDGPVLPESESLLLELVWTTRKRSFAYLMKTRDSMYVRLDILLQDVVHRLIANESNAYLGYFDGQQKPNRHQDSSILHQEPRSTKHNEPDWFLCDYFIRFAHSGGYILSKELVHRLAAQAYILFPYNNEDVALGTWLSPYNDISWIHNINFDTEVGRSRGCRNSFLVFPSATKMVQYQRLQNGGSVCVVEQDLVQTYWYDFNTSPSKCCTPVEFEHTVL